MRTKNFKRILIVLSMAIVMAASAIAVVSADDVGSVTVKAGITGMTAANRIDYLKQDVTVKGDAAENVGYTDNGDTSKVTALDLFVAIHEDKYGASFRKNPEDYLVCSGGWFNKVCAQSTYDISYLLNRTMTETTANETILKDGDEIDIFRYRDTDAYSDHLAYFVEDNVSAKIGEEVTLKLEGGAVWGADYATLTNEEGGSITPVLVNTKTNAFTTIDGAELNDNGEIKLTFDEPGEYIVSAFGKVYYDVIDDVTPITNPVARITVTKQETTPDVKPVTKPAKVTGLKLKAGKKKITVSYNKQSGVKYQIAYKVTGTKKLHYVKTSNVSKTIKNLKKNRYTVKVRAYKTVNGKTYYGSWSTFKRVKVK